MGGRGRAGRDVADRVRNGGRLQASAEPDFLGNSGTSMRLLTAVAALAQGRSLLTGTDRLQARPMQDLLDGLARLGVRARSLGTDGCAPIEIEGGAVPGGCAELDCSLSSQFLTALLLIGPYARDGIEITRDARPGVAALHRHHARRHAPVRRARSSAAGTSGSRCRAGSATAPAITWSKPTAPRPATSGPRRPSPAPPSRCGAPRRTPARGTRASRRSWPAWDARSPRIPTEWP